MKNLIIFLFLIAFLFCPFMYLYAAEEHGIIVSPLIIDDKAQIRDILEYSIKIKNTNQNRIDFYPIINDISAINGKQEFLDYIDLDKSTSLASWTQFNRGVIELLPNEEKEITLTIKINVHAKPGKYYAVITFANGSNRHEAESLAKKLNQPKLMLNIEVEEHIIEKAEIKMFQVEKNINLSSPINFLLEIKNIGNKEIKPSGFISIYNRKGKQIKSININQDQIKILPQENNRLIFNWDTPNGFGKYKARLEAEYGINQVRDLQDTIYFWILPWSMLVISIGIVLFLLIILTIIIYRRMHHNYNYYSGKASKDKVNMK